MAVREFAEGELAPIAQECEVKEEFPRELIKKAAQLGFIGVFFKKEYGGLGLGYSGACHHPGGVLEGRSGTWVRCWLNRSFGSEQLILFGTEEQKKKYLAALGQRRLGDGFLDYRTRGGK